MLTRHAGIESRHCCPLASALLTCLVEDLGDHGLAVLVVELEDVRGDLDQEGVKDTLVPLGENVCDLILRAAETALEDVVGLSDKLHVTIFDT